MIKYSETTQRFYLANFLEHGCDQVTVTNILYWNADLIGHFKACPSKVHEKQQDLLRDLNNYAWFWLDKRDKVLAISFYEWSLSADCWTAAQLRMVAAVECGCYRQPTSCL